MMYADQKICFSCTQPYRESNYENSCDLCGINQESYYYERDFKQNQQSNQKCPNCTFNNPEDSIQCKICDYVFQDRIKSKLKKQILLKACPVCKLQNDILNEYCLNCQNQLIQQQRKPCPICNFKINVKTYDIHCLECLLSQQLIQKQQKSKPLIPIKQLKPDLVPVIPKQIIRKIPYLKKRFPVKSVPIYKGGLQLFAPILVNPPEASKFCFWCKQQFDEPSILQAHMKNCSQKISLINAPEYNRMTPLQITAIKYMDNKSSIEHKASQGALQARIKKLGYNNQDLNNLSFYIENYAPIIIQVHVSKHMEFFIKDTHYRSQFETNKSSGSLSRASRTQWENRMFDNQYAKASDYQRVKYGVINFTNDPKGVQCAKSYGPSYFLLKSHVRERCTFTDKDSSNSDSSISTLKYSFKVVSKMNDQEIIAAIKASKALQESSGVTVTYKEIQIHGPIQFSKDIERIYVSKQEIKQKKMLDMVYEFSAKYKVDYDFIS